MSKPTYAELEKRIQILEQAESDRVKTEAVSKKRPPESQSGENKIIHDSHERFLTVLNSIDATIYVADMDTHEVLFANQYLIESFGRDVTGEICWKAFRNVSEPCPHCTNKNLVDGDGKPAGVSIWQGQNPITGKWYINHDRAIEWTDGRLVKLQIATDITERKRAEERLRKSEEQYREFFDDNITGTYITTPEGRLIACNREYEKIFGFTSSEQALNTPITQLCCSPEEREIFLDQIRKKKRVTGYESSLRRVDGSLVQVVENSSGVFDENGDLKRIRGFLLDITEQKKLESQLIQSQKLEAIGTLAGGIAHDFNNILTGIFGYAKLAKMKVNEPDQVDINIDRIIIGAQRASDLVRQILTFSRHSEYKKRPFEVISLVKEVLQLMRATIPTSISIKENIISGAKIMADPSQIHQVIINLCTNAYQDMLDSGGVLSVGLSEVRIGDQESVPDLNILPGSYLKFEVGDTGQGMDKETMGKIFNPFFTTKEVGKGTGLGLAVVDGIVKDHRGFIKVESELGKGTVFKVFLPIVDVPEP